jgi:hypothetical protein
MNTLWGFVRQQKDKSLHAVPVSSGAASIELACRIQADGCNCRLAFLWQLLVLSGTAFSLLELSSQIVLHIHMGLDILQDQTLSVSDLSPTSGFQDMRRGCMLAGHQWCRWAETRIQTLSLRALRMLIRLRNLFSDTGFWRPNHTSQSKCS